MEFIIEEKLIGKSLVENLLQEAHELTSIFITTRKTAAKNPPSSIVHHQSS